MPFLRIAHMPPIGPLVEVSHVLMPDGSRRNYVRMGKDALARIIMSINLDRQEVAARHGGGNGKHRH